MLKAYFGCFRKYFVFRGRASRSEYWYFFLINLFITLTIILLSRASGSYYVQYKGQLVEYSYPLLSVYQLVILFPHLAVTVRRLHDVGLSGWWVIGYYLGMVFLLGMALSSVLASLSAAWVFGVLALVFVAVPIYFLAKAGQPGENKYGKPIGSDGVVDESAEEYVDVRKYLPKFCRHCGAPARSTTGYCVNCGKQLYDEAAMESARAMAKQAQQEKKNK